MKRAAAAVLGAIVALVLFSGCSLLPVSLGGGGQLTATAFCPVAASNIPSPSQRARDRRPRAFANSSATDQNGIHVEIESDATSHSCDQPIDVQARLSYTGPQDSIELGMDGPSLLEFGVREMDGPFQTYPAPTSGCTDVTLKRGDVHSIPFFKSGSPTTYPPEFARVYFADPTLNLPVGTWEIFALGSYVPGGCDPPGKTARTPVSVVVTISG